jgi:membrane-associated phospholipid phosphatase
MDQTIKGWFSVSLNDHAAANTTGDVLLGAEPLVSLTKPTDAFLAEKQLGYLRTAADLRGDRLSEIRVQTGRILPFFAMVGHMSKSATPWSIAVASAVLRLCKTLEMPLKMGFNVARPVSMAYELQPVIQTPGHPAWPSGHATESFALATVLTRLFYQNSFDTVTAITSQNELMRHAARIAMNRTVAGMHFPTDSMAGAVLGITVGEALVRVLDGEDTATHRSFDGAAYAGDFNLSLLGEAISEGGFVGSETIPAHFTVPDWLTTMWTKAKAEW